MSKDTEKVKKEDVDVAAYFLAQKKYTYDELCWLLAERLLIEDRLPPGESTEDALKFFINWVKVIVDVGGPNLPKTISSNLGAKLAKLYKSRGITTIERALKTSYDAIQGKAEISTKDDGNLEVETKYLRNFCPIGGEPNSESANIIQNSLCVPFTMGFLNEIDSNYRYEGIIHKCIVKNGGNVCIYTLKKEEKK